MALAPRHSRSKVRVGFPILACSAVFLFTVGRIPDGLMKTLLGFEHTLRQSLVAPIPASLETALSQLDGCIETARSKNFTEKAPCVRCHSIANPATNNIKMNFYWKTIQTHFAEHGGCQTVCEVGFNRGDSAVVWLEACAHALIGFSWTAMVYKAWSILLESKYRDRFTFIRGNSLTSAVVLSRTACCALRCFAPCGCKDTACRKRDMENFLPFTHDKTLWLSDDVELACTDRRQPNINSVHTCQNLVPSGNSRQDLASVFFNFSETHGMETECIADQFVANKGYLDGACVAVKRETRILVV